MKMLSIDEIKLLVAQNEKLIEQNRELQKENRMLNQQFKRILPAKSIVAAVLTRRECEVLSLISLGLTNKEIAGRLYLALSTVRTYINRIYQKLDLDAAECKSAVRVQAALIYLWEKHPDADLFMGEYYDSI